MVLLSLFDIFVKENQKVLQWFHLFRCQSDFYVVTLRMHSMRFVKIFKRKKLIAIVNWVFYSQWTWRSFIMLIKYGLILSRRSSIDSFFSLSPLLSYLIKLSSKALLILAGSYQSSFYVSYINVTSINVSSLMVLSFLFYSIKISYVFDWLIFGVIIFIFW